MSDKPGGSSGATILVVDDTPESLRFLTATLERAGMTVLIAVDGFAALDLLDHVTPDLVLMDGAMPGLDGFETTQRIKADGRFRSLPVIFMTGLTETEHVVRGLEAGAVDYVHKPIVVDELLARVSVHLANARISQGSQLALDPIFANQWEGGVKVEAFSKKLNLTASYYNITIDNATRTDANLFTIQDGKQVSKGMEVELIASPVTGLSIIAGYAYNDNKIVRASDKNIEGNNSKVDHSARHVKHV